MPMKVTWFRFRHFRLVINCLSGILVANLSAVAQDSRIVDIPNVIDAAKAEVLGLRLYMSAREASAVIQEKLQVNVFGRECAQSTPCISFSDTELTPRKKYVERIYIQNKKLELSLTFTEAFPFDSAKPELLTGISYTPVLETVAAQDAFTQQVKQKYGPTAPVAQAALFWCTRGVAPGGFVDILHSQVSQCEGPSLVLRGTNLYLSDSGLLARELAKKEAIKNAEAPPL